MSRTYSKYGGLTTEEFKTLKMIKFDLVLSGSPENRIKAMDAIHLIQGLFQSRIVSRKYPKFWPIYDSSLNNCYKLEISSEEKDDVNFQSWLRFYEAFCALPVYHATQQDDVRRGLNSIFEIIRKGGDV